MCEIMIDENYVHWITSAFDLTGQSQRICLLGYDDAGLFALSFVLPACFMSFLFFVSILWPRTLPLCRWPSSWVMENDLAAPGLGQLGLVDVFGWLLTHWQYRIICI